ncbi:MAG: type II secretion system protein [Nitrospinota bacterium]
MKIQKIVYIELALFVLIIGVILSVLLPHYYKHRTVSECAKEKIVLSKLITELESYYLINQNYPTYGSIILESLAKNDGIQNLMVDVDIYFEELTPTTYTIRVQNRYCSPSKGSGHSYSHDSGLYKIGHP